jgi:SAM-dependent methyltransferase
MSEPVFETHGYYTGSEYELYTVFQAMNPSRMRFMTALHGIAAPDVTSGFSYCELGCGQGFSLLMHAAMHPTGRFHGVDFAAGQIARAQSLAREMNLDNVSFEAASFEQFAATSDDMYDVIALHGVWSWIGRGAQEHILQIIRHRLNPGGLVYVSANMQPGWAAVVPFQSLLLSIRRAMPGASSAAVIARFNALLDLDPPLLEKFPTVRKGLAAALAQSPSYFEHEYLHDEWRPVLFSELAADMASAGTAFACSSVPARRAWRVSGPVHALMATIEDPIERETIFDALTAETFRADYFVREPVALSPDKQKTLIGETPMAVVNAGLLSHTTIKQGGVFSAAHAEVLEAVKSRLLQGPCLIGSLSALPGAKAHDLGVVTDVILYLMAVGACEISLGSVDDPELTRRAQRFNRVALRLYQMVGRSYQLACAILRAPVSVSITDVVCLRAMMEGHDPAEELLRIGESKGMQLSTDGTPMADEGAKRRMVALTCKAWPRLRGSELIRLGLLDTSGALRF